jgi:hypothetical protein
MTITEYVTTLLSSAAVTVVLTGTLFWLLKNWLSERLRTSIKHEYDVLLESHKAQLLTAFNAENETHKARLHAENAAATERLKAELSIAAAERQIRFARLHEKVADSVAEMYSRLSTFAISLERYTSVLETPTMGSKEERRLAMAEALREFDEYFRKHELYIPKELANRIKTFVEKLHGMAVEFMVGVEQGGDNRYADRDTWVKVDKELRGEARPLLEGLKDEFRGLLGVASSPPSRSA